MGVGVPFNRGMAAVNVRFTPLDISATRTVLRSPTHTLSAGLGVVADYGYEAYTAQTGARLFWQGEVGLNIVLKYDYRWEGRGTVGLTVRNSAAGFVSCTRHVEPYFYSLRFTDFFTKPHRDMRFGSVETYSHTRAEAEFRPDRARGHSFGVGVEYVDVRLGRRFRNLNCFLQWGKRF